MYPDMTIFDASGPPILGDEDGGAAGDDDVANIRWVFGDAASSDSDDVIACNVREGGDGVMAGTRVRPGIGIGGDDGAGMDAAAVVVLTSWASLASRMAATHALASSCDSACR
jgi:hypothetical protein